jgi:hypothetical protein
MGTSLYLPRNEVNPGNHLKLPHMYILHTNYHHVLRIFTKKTMRNFKFISGKLDRVRKYTTAVETTKIVKFKIFASPK